jgi:hypothetical protein
MVEPPQRRLHNGLQQFVRWLAEDEQEVTRSPMERVRQPKTPTKYVPASRRLARVTMALVAVEIWGVEDCGAAAMRRFAYSAVSYLNETRSFVR